MDHDDSMLSSPSSTGDPDETFDEDNLFPDSHAHDAIAAADAAAAHIDPSINAIDPRPQTPQNDHLNAAAPGELSPPRSHSTNVNQAAVAAAAARNTAAAAAQMTDDGEDLSPTTANRAFSLGVDDGEWKPGAGWKGKKAQEEMQRACENVVDRDFSLKEFGDVMAHRLSK